jgi:RNA recognition motif-containing protein
MSTKVYVGNLAFSVADKDLREAFAAYGDLTEVTIIMDRFSGRSKGFGFITFADDEAAKKAVDEMNGKDIQGRAIKVSVAKPMEERSSRPQRSFGRRY